MRLVIEREGGFTVVEDADAITEIDVMNNAVKLTIEVGGDKWTVELPVSSHGEACRVSAAIALRCGELVEPLSKGPDEVTASDGLDDAADDDVIGAAMAGLVRKNSTPWRPAKLGEWVAGEPPRGGVLVEPLVESEDDKRERALLEGLGELAPRLVARRMMSDPGEVIVPPMSLGQWVAGEPPRGGLWYVVARAGAFGCVAWDGVRFRDWYSETVLMDGEVAHLPTPVPSRR